MGRYKKNSGRLEYIPTPEEIRRLCWKIQDTWPEAERAKRALYLADLEAVRFEPEPTPREDV